MFGLELGLLLLLFVCLCAKIRRFPNNEKKLNDESDF